MRTVDLDSFIARHPYAVVDEQPGKYLPRRFVSLACAVNSAGNGRKILGPDGEPIHWTVIGNELRRQGR